jgi:hypothetical protein
VRSVLGPRHQVEGVSGRAGSLHVVPHGEGTNGPVGESDNSSGIPATLIEHWDGTSWNIVASPAPGSASLLSGASADTDSGQAWAVGNFTPVGGGATQTLTEFNP